MDGGMMGAVLGLCVACVAFLAWMIDRQGLRLERILQAEVSKIEGAAFPDLDELKEDVADMIAETMSSMRTPQIADHIGGILSQWAQIKFAKEMQAMQGGILPAVADAVTDHFEDEL